MLDTDDGRCVISGLWDKAESKTALPADLEYLAGWPTGCPINNETRRAYERLPCSFKAVLIVGRTSYGVYVRDISKGGAGVLTPMQLFPRDTGWLLLPGEKKVQLQVRRCRRMREGCYECGVVFTGGDHSHPRFLSEFAGSGI